MNNLFTAIQNFIQNLFGSGQGGLSNDEKIVKRLMAALEKTEEEELACDEVFELLDQYAELVINNEAARSLMPLVAHHLEMCKHCSEEYEALVEVMGLV